MNRLITVSHKELRLAHILELLKKFDKCFNPPFSQSIDLETYADKLSQHAYFIVAEAENNIVGLLAYYRNDFEKELYVPYLVVDNTFQGHSIGKLMLEKLNNIHESIYQTVVLEVVKTNFKALHFYKRNGFKEEVDRGNKFLMIKRLCVHQ
ncbi:MAG: GNAT family N-acetyltransferase [Bacteroidales bacterium]|nr:GNAT family N-acetyltransferase [Bacteroidales bacterium]